MSKPNLATAIRSAGGSTRHSVPEPVNKAYKQPSRQGTKPITAHYPKEVSDRLKILAVEQDTTLQDLIAEALNDLFAKYGKPEIVPTNKNNPR
jgi:predicted HicB family RNase H-like nuclease